jgi:hypothetical protein
MYRCLAAESGAGGTCTCATGRTSPCSSATAATPRANNCMPNPLQAALRLVARSVGLPLGAVVLAVGSGLRMLSSLRAPRAVPGLGARLLSHHHSVLGSRISSHAAAGPHGPQELAPEVESLIKGIHATPTKAVVYVTGGAVQVSATAAKLCSMRLVPLCSRVV